jgi:hypothetical protein
MIFASHLFMAFKFCTGFTNILWLTLFQNNFQIHLLLYSAYEQEFCGQWAKLIQIFKFILLY